MERGHGPSKKRWGSCVQRWHHRRDKTEVAAADLNGRSERISTNRVSGSEVNLSVTQFERVLAIFVRIFELEYLWSIG